MSSGLADPAAVREPAIHDGLLYRTPADYLAGVLPFLHAGLAAAHAVFVAVPRPNLDRLRPALGFDAARITFADMTAVGRNPGRIMPTIHRFVDAHPGRRVRFVCEPIWPGRSAAEISEATRHEAMLNAAFGTAAVDILCPYDADRLDPAVVADAWRTHPHMIDAATRRASKTYGEPAGFAADDALPLIPRPPDHTPVLPVDISNLTGLRVYVRAYAEQAGLGARAEDLVLAVNEITTNTVLHARAPGTLQIWAVNGSVMCELHDSGVIADALAGRRPPSDGSDHGRGLWMVNELCDLVQLRSTSTGTTIRLQVDARTH
jgi:anti-sigma regulatory factor (Ser/Thr protein kinase)